VSTSKPPLRTYHHGDLRRALLEAALSLIEARGADDVSLREIARAVGVSPAAVYRHFPDKQALMEAVAGEGLARLAAAQHAAADGLPDVNAAFAASGRAYVRFALANPGLFRATFTYPGVTFAAPAEDAAGRLLHAHATALAGGDARRASVVATRAWALVHGLALLMLDGRLPADPQLIDAAIETAPLL
jgi:AcrR family transcriptional regulator